MSNARDIRASHGRNPHEGLCRLTVRGDMHFFRLRLGLLGIVLRQGFCSGCCRRGAGLLDVGLRSRGLYVVVLVEFQRSRVAITRDMAFEIESCAPLSP